jgi:hypothetical protein
MAQFIGYEQIATGPVLGTFADLTIPPNTVRAYIQAETANVRYTMDGDGVNPTVITGMLLLQGLAPEWFEREDLARIRFIGDGGGVGRLNIHYYGTVDA